MRKGFYIISIVFIFITLHIPQVVNAEVMNTSAFYEAGIAYKNGNYTKAIKLYNDIIQKGKVSGNLYYNLANTYFKKGKLGKAILNYERARQYIPLDSDLKSNYSYVSALVKYSSIPKKQNFISKIVNKYSSNFTLDDLASFCLILYIIIGIYIFISLFLEVRKKKIIVGSFLMAIVFIFNFAVLFFSINDIKNEAVALKDTDATFEPVKDSTTHFTLSAGTEVKILSKDDGWVKIKRIDGKKGWVPKDTVESVL